MSDGVVDFFAVFEGALIEGGLGMSLLEPGSGM